MENNYPATLAQNFKRNDEVVTDFGYTNRKVGCGDEDLTTRNRSIVPHFQRPFFILGVIAGTRITGFIFGIVPDISRLIANEAYSKTVTKGIKVVRGGMDKIIVTPRLASYVEHQLGVVGFLITKLIAFGRNTKHAIDGNSGYFASSDFGCNKIIVGHKVEVAVIALDVTSFKNVSRSTQEFHCL